MSILGSFKYRISGIELFFCYLGVECGLYGPAGTEVSPQWARQKRAAAGFGCTFSGILITDFFLVNVQY